MDTAQVCDRLLGQETCPFHKGQITSLCKTCGILVCMECVMSSEHEGHTFKKITSCLREPADNLAKHITEIEKKLLIAVEKELSEMKKQRTQSVEKQNKGAEQIKEQRQQAHTQIDTNADSMEVQWYEHSQQVLDILDKHILGLESLRKQLNEERKECLEILEKGSIILKYDAGLEITKKTKMERIPKPPTIAELEYNKCGNNFNELLFKAMGILEEVNLKPGIEELPVTSQASSSELEKQNQYRCIETISNTNNESPWFPTIVPIEKNIAWASECIYDNVKEIYSYTNMLFLIDSRRSRIQQLALDTNVYTLETHPITRQLFCINDKFKSVRSIDTSTGKTKQIVKCPIDIERLKVTHDNHVIVGSRDIRNAVYKYKLTGQLVNESPEKYQVHYIAQCPHTNRVAISRGKEGLTLLNSDLSMIKSYSRSECKSAIFNSYGNLLVGDYLYKQIIILDGGSLSFIQKLEINGISCPLKLELYDNILWLSCKDPCKLICARIT